MIENKLDFDELSSLLKPFLQLEKVSDLMSSFALLFDFKIENKDDINNYLNKFRVTYKGFRIHFRQLTKIGDNLQFHLQFRIEKKWWHEFVSPNGKILNDIKKICLRELSDLTFATYERSIIQNERYKSELVKFKYFYDSKAFRSPTNDDGIHISPLIIGTDTNDRYRFVEFAFNGGCYKKEKASVVLKTDWRDYH